MKILVLGGAGMLGHKMVQRLSTGAAQVFWTLRQSKEESTLDPVPGLRGEGVLENIDAENLPALEKMISAVVPNVIVNCLGVIKQRSNASAPIPSITINALLPHKLATLASAWGGRVIHFSTDCVFSGKRGQYAEDDDSDATDLYGKTKFLGEVGYPNALTLRTSIIGRELGHHQSLLDWFLAQEGGTVRGYRQSWWSGVTTNHLADLVAWMIDKHPDLHGLFQVSSGRISKYDLLLAIRERYNLEVKVTPDDSLRCDRSLIGDRFANATGYRCPSWPDLIDQLVSDPTPYRALKR